MQYRKVLRFEDEVIPAVMQFVFRQERIPSVVICTLSVSLL